MMPTVNVGVRAYTNTRREQQAAQTRALILDAVIRVLARGVAELSIPAVAREAGVSISTIYRNFPSKRELLIALGTHMDERAGYLMEPRPHTPGDLASAVHQAYHQADTLDPEIQAAYATSVGQEVRQARDIPVKLDLFREPLAPIFARLDPTHQRYLLHMVTILISRYTFHRFKVDLGLSAEEAADTVEWTLRTLFRALGEDAPPPLG